MRALPSKWRGSAPGTQFDPALVELFCANAAGVLSSIGLALATALPTVSAQAQSAHTFVSPTGNDSNPGCSIAAPCRTFQAALAATTASGEISVLGTADYGTFTINKAISIVNGGGFEAGIMVPSQGTGI